MSASEIPAADDSFASGGVSVNERAGRKQKLFWGVAMVVLVGGASWFIMDYMSDDTSGAKKDPDEAARMVATAGLARGGGQDTSRELAVRVQSLDADNRQLQSEKAQLLTELERAKAESATNHDNALKTINALNSELEMRSAAPPPVAAAQGGAITGPSVAPPPYSSAGDPFAPVGAGGQGASHLAGAFGARSMDTAGQPNGRRSVSVIRAGGAKPAQAAEPEASEGKPANSDSAFVRSGVQTFDSKRFVPPNAYVKAKVLVGVDATTGVSQQADPKPVMFRLVGPATHVGANGNLQTTDLTGCVVNGAAYAELPSEKVYIKLQRISCPAGPKQFSVSAVEGYVSHRGKAGVRGQVVSRDAGLMGRAMIAGTFQGLGQSLENYTNRNMGGLTVGSTGQVQGAAPLDAGQVAAGAFGGGVGNAASTLADYWIKRAEQYQPVIEMPTGIEVELVFLTGFEIGKK